MPAISTMKHFWYCDITVATNNDDDHNDEHNTETYSEPCHKSKMESFAKIVNGLKVLAIFAKRFILDIWQGFECVFVIF